MNEEKNDIRLSGVYRLRFLWHWVDLLICVVLAFLFTAAPHYMKEDSFSFTADAAKTVLMYSAVFFCATVALRFFLSMDKVSAVDDAGVLKNSSAGESPIAHFLNRRFSILLMALIMLLFWLPTLVCLWPGTAINDTWDQLQQFMRVFQNGRVYLEFLSDHHPVADTWVMGQIIVPLARVTGSWHNAFFCYVLLQSFLTCAAFSSVVIYCYRKLRMKESTAIVIFLIYCILFIFPGSAQTISKDALFSWIYVFFSIQYIEIVRSEGQYLEKPGNRDQFLITCIACCLTKKVGFYVLLFSLVIAAAVIRKARKRLLVPALVCLIFMKAALPLFMSATHIHPGGVQEMFSVPFQMTARYVKYHPDDITEEEYAAIDEVLIMRDLADRYWPDNSDPVRRWTQLGEKKDYLVYIGTWARQGLRHPDTYWDALMAMEAGWFSWTKYYPLTTMEWHIRLNTRMIPEETTIRPEPFRILSERVRWFADRLYHVPVIGMLFSYGLYSALIPAFVIGSLIVISIRKRNRSWVAALPMLFSLALGCWLAPVSTHFEGLRYLYPLTYTAFLNLTWCRYQYRGRR